MLKGRKFKKAYVGFTKYTDNPWITYNTNKKYMYKRNNKGKRKNFQDIEMFKNPFDKNEKIEWHHITDTYIVALPRDLHRLYLGKLHREKTMKIVKQIYLEG